MVRKRVREFRKKIETDYYKKDATILIISHGGFLKNFIGNILDMGIKDSIEKLQIDNASYSELFYEKEKFKIITLNDISHLR